MRIADVLLVAAALAGTGSLIAQAAPSPSNDTTDSGATAPTGPTAGSPRSVHAMIWAQAGLPFARLGDPCPANGTPAKWALDTDYRLLRCLTPDDVWTVDDSQQRIEESATQYGWN
ncbi:hypothetical protein [Paraburkholderia sp.]|uniref:hypothetical protein n=1 Tax=Paraburkholderia sp. TaxID=1926495 RepID=UPI00238749D0|nr:hypothetical protein [Paraburkholderia sp.]MDE1179039.1 hypothetical protein [Paraburkholderia sp.]